jgi:beta-mannosidase
MVMNAATVKLAGMRALVRYVDEEQAVIDAHFRTMPVLPEAARGFEAERVDVLVEIDGMDGFHDEGQTRLILRDGGGSVRFDLVQPSRWWPAGMGEQAMYRVGMKLFVHDDEADARDVAVGLTSVRRDPALLEPGETTLLVNGQVCELKSLIVVDRVQQTRLLPAGGDSLLIVRDHYGDDTLFDAADRAGILVIQCVPVDACGSRASTLADHVERLSHHPSLIGYYVGHLGPVGNRLAKCVRDLDPTRSVFRKLPQLDAA